ncbi:MAG: hypothetical protein AB1779_05815 [Candidatus Thermoplasmatota archaeon]
MINSSQKLTWIVLSVHCLIIQSQNTDIPVSFGMCIYENVNINGAFDVGESDPLNPDTDGDELNDGLEARGWTVGIHWERKMENKGARDVYSNPTIWDTDGDILLDNQEMNPVDGTQISNPIGIKGKPPVIGTFEVKVKAKPGILAGWETTISLLFISLLSLLPLKSSLSYWGRTFQKLRNSAVSV